MRYEIKNWSEFQQYKDDRPMHWIKLHNKLLDDYNFNQLTEITQLHLLKLWLVASKNNGIIEGDEQWIAMLIRTKKVDIEGLVQSGFLIRTNSYESVPREELDRAREELDREELDKNAGVNTEASTARQPCPYDEILKLYHDKLPMLPKVVALSDHRKRAIKARWSNGMYGLENWENYFEDVSQSKFLTGKVDPPKGRKQFIADIDFLIRESTILKTQEGKYHG